jgi:RNA polymerase sigma-70 factor (ECF subfamily)
LVQRLIAVLDDNKRDVFVLAEIEEFRPAEIAETLGIGLATVSSRLRAARRDFKRAAQRHHRRDVFRVG